MAPSTDSTWRPPATDSKWPPPTPEPALAPPSATTESSWRTPTSPREVASSVVASVQYVTSSVRLLFTGCFQCQSLKGGCWRRQEEPDGAWFDCDKLQAEHPYCYVNPVALTDGTAPANGTAIGNGASTGTAIGNGTSTDTVLSQQPKAKVKSPTTETSSPVKSPSSKSPSKDPTEPSSPKDVVANEVISDDGVLAVKGDSVIYKNGRVRSGLVESFAAKLEADLRRIECDRQRADGEILAVKDVRTPSEEDVISFPDYLCADVEFFKEEGVEIPSYPYDGFKINRNFEHDVWKPSELEDAFECYNTAAFYSYGASSLQVGTERGTSKNKGEKFEEVFPASTFNNNNTIKVYRPAIDSESPLRLKDESIKENVTHIEICDRKREISEDELKQFIYSCVVAKDAESIGLRHIPSETPAVVCDDLIYYGNKSFNKLLIYNLVKSVMADCQELYCHSMPLCANYPVHLVQNKILSVLQDDKNIYQLNTSGLQAFRNSSFLNTPDSLFQQQQQLVAEKMVERVVLDELRREMKDWKDVSREEAELKEAISTEIVHDLISDTASIFDEILRRKVML